MWCPERSDCVGLLKVRVSASLAPRGLLYRNTTVPGMHTPGDWIATGQQPSPAQVTTPGSPGTARPVVPAGANQLPERVREMLRQILSTLAILLAVLLLLVLHYMPPEAAIVAVPLGVTGLLVIATEAAIGQIRRITAPVMVLAMYPAPTPTMDCPDQTESPSGAPDILRRSRAPCAGATAT
ncbi:MAG: hypothetical protein Q8R28_19305 [Dehalococcoidia bacterium]|nr:hypothetical protein [Dehalococcoidia bacterium]